MSAKCQKATSVRVQSMCAFTPTPEGGERAFNVRFASDITKLARLLMRSRVPILAIMHGTTRVGFGLLSGFFLLYSSPEILNSGETLIVGRRPFPHR